MIVESIHIRFDEIKEVTETSVANNTSGLVPQRQKALDYDNPGPVPQRQYVSSLADEHVPSQQELDLLFDYDNPDPVPQRQDVYSLADVDVRSQQELDLLFGHLYDEYFNAGSNPSTNVQSTSVPSPHINVHVEENNNDQAEKGEHLQDDEFTN
nr:hypothetical protein [Tanacetum cinerariifolium]